MPRRPPMLVALLVVLAIPLFSIRLGKKATEDITTYQHCWAEFFVPGYGWVTADPADVRGLSGWAAATAPQRVRPHAKMASVAGVVQPRVRIAGLITLATRPPPQPTPVLRLRVPDVRVRNAGCGRPAWSASPGATPLPSTCSRD